MRRSPDELAAFLTAQAERMRLAPTPSEQRLWERLEPLGFDRQVPIMGETKNGGTWSYIADFLHKYRNLIVEVDGGVHRKQKGRDRRRGARLVTRGFETIRFPNRLVASDLDGVVARIREALQ